MTRNFAELQERVKSSESPMVSVAQVADQGVLLLVKAAADRGFVEPVLTGGRERIEELCGHIGFKPLEILRAGMEEEAVEQAIRAVHDGSAQVLMKGPVNTSVYMRGILNREWRLRTGRLLSMMAVYEVPNCYKLLFCSDNGISVAPDLEQKKDILKNLLYTVQNMGMQNPKAMVFTANEMMDPKVVSTTDTAGLIEAAENEGGFPPCIIKGPIAFDVVFNSKSAAHKKIDSRITGDVDLAIFSNIEVGNIMGKSQVHFCYSSRGDIVLGVSSPVILGSHPDTVEIKLSPTALACLAAQSGK